MPTKMPSIDVYPHIIIIFAVLRQVAIVSDCISFEKY